MEIVFATNNENKVKEVQLLLPENIKILKLKDIRCNQELPETHHTIEENSLEKAEFVFENYVVNCFSEDTGLEIEALNGEPSVFSARYAGEQRNDNANMDLVLEKLKNIENRNAQFKTIITLILDNQKYQFEGILKGKIGTEKKGNNGFGYDPIFIIEDGRTLAELTIEEKATMSHRGKAVHKLITFLKDYL